uniref:Integrase zinc-binding domain-containing protein n=1 Tax=Amphimedon queenslandica TaxID=400682 RepID=A0A1X7UWM1_AMPQE
MLVFQNGVKETLTELRAKYWVVKARLSVKTVISSCNLCRWYGGLADKAPPPPPLPSFRVTKHPPFSYTGVDYAGPLYVKPDYPAQARCEQKVFAYTLVV